MDRELLQRLIQMAVQCGAAYYVYKDSQKKNVPYMNLWVAGTFLFLPVILVYFFYRQREARGIKLTLKQKAQLQIDHKREEEKRKIAAERARMEIERRAELEKNRVSDEELEKLHEERRVAKAKRMKELEEQRAEQEKQHAKLLKLKEKNLQDTVARNLGSINR